MRAFLGLVALLSLLAGCGGALGTATPPKTHISPEELRRNTVSVRVEPSPKLAELFDRVASTLERGGHADAAVAFAESAGGSLGSGFLVSHRGEMFVVTNRHVVDFAGEAEVSLDATDRRWAVDVVYTDAVYDLAVLAFRTPPPRGAGLRLAGARAHDLETVYATGFPGLDGEPSYQVTRGQVSNERFMASSRGRSIRLLQHTAPIDPGSSGGPLTVDSGEVVGVNFIKFAGRDNVYLAIPADAVASVLDEAVAAKRGSLSRSWLSTRLDQACGRLVAGLRRRDEPPVEVYDVITNDAVASWGFPSVEALAHEDGRIWDALSQNPTAVMRLAVALFLWRDAHARAGLPVACRTAKATPGTRDVRVVVTFEKGNRETTWRFEQGAWKLAAFDSVRAPDPAPPRPRKGRPKAERHGRR